MKNLKTSLFALALVLLMVSNPAFAAEPTYGPATVDGDFSEWDLANDFFADMYVAGDSTNPVLSKLFLRYDCSTYSLYALVLEMPEDGKSPDLQPEDAWLKLHDWDWSDNKLIDGNGEGNTSPRGFAWVYAIPGEPASQLIDYEAYARLYPGSYAAFEAHLSIGGDSSSTGALVEE